MALEKFPRAWELPGGRVDHLRVLILNAVEGTVDLLRLAGRPRRAPAASSVWPLGHRLARRRRAFLPPGPPPTARVFNVPVRADSPTAPG